MRPSQAEQGLSPTAATAYPTLTPPMNAFMHQRKPLLPCPKSHGVLQTQVASATLDHQGPRQMRWNYVGFSTGRGQPMPLSLLPVCPHLLKVHTGPHPAAECGKHSTSRPPPAPQPALSHHGVGLGDLHLRSSDSRPWLPRLL